MNVQRFLVLLTLVVAAVLARLLPHPPNFTPIGALALFGGACFADRRLAFLLPLAALFVSDLFGGLLGPHSVAEYTIIFVVYISFCMNVLLGRWLRSARSSFLNPSPPTPLPQGEKGEGLRSVGAFVLALAGVTFLGSVQFFVTTNFACWLLYYPHTLAGLTECYVGALPFFRYTLLGDVTYATALFGGLAVVERVFPRLRETGPQPSFA